MLSEDELKRIYLNDKIKEIILFFRKLTPKEIQKTSVIVKKFLNNDWRHNHGSELTLSVSNQTHEQYGKLAPGFYILPVSFLSKLLKSLNYFLRYIMNCHILISHKLIRLLQGD